MKEGQLQQQRRTKHHVSTEATMDRLGQPSRGGRKDLNGKSDKDNNNNSGEMSSSESGSGRQMTKTMPIPAPIYFLVREQAKSLVAIKELKDRVRNLEQVQEEVFEAVHELRLDSESQILEEASKTFPGLVLPNSAMYGTNRKSAVSRTNRINSKADFEGNSDGNGRFREIAQTVGDAEEVVASKKKDFNKGDDPENKQDSGVDSDCQIQMSLNAIPQPASILGPVAAAAVVGKYDDDVSGKLMKILDDIETKSLRMRIQASDQERLIVELPATDDKSNLLHTCKGLQAQLRDLRKENETLRKRAELAERYVEKLTFDRSLMDSKMELVLAEKKQLESTIHELHKKFVKTQMSGGGGASKKSAVTFQTTPEHGEVAEKTSTLPPVDRPRSLEDSKSKMSNILKEKNVLELQRQLLAYVLENEVLVTKVEEAEKLRTLNAKESEAFQSKLKKNIDKLMREKSEFGKLYENKRKELDAARQDLSSARGKVGRLEKDLNALNQYSELDPYAELVRVDNDTASFIDFNEQPNPKSKAKECQSLPPVLYAPGGANHHVLKEIFASDHRGYLDLSQAIESDEETVTVSPFFESATNPSRGKPAKTRSFLRDGASQAVPGTRTPSILDMDKSELDSICSEFDPLSQSGEDERGSKVDFEDSLDVNPVSSAKDFASRASSYGTAKSRLSEPRVKYAHANVERYLRRDARGREEPANISQLLDLSIDEELL